MNARLNEVIQTFQHWWQRPVDLSAHILLPVEPEEEIRYLHEEYETELRECVRCDILYDTTDRDYSTYCDECYALRDEGRD